MSQAQPPETIDNTILANAERYPVLWDAIAALGDVDVQLKQQQSLLVDLEKQVTAADKKIVQASVAKRNMQALWEEARASGVRRALARFSSSATKVLDDAEAKAQCNYAVAVQNEEEAQERRNVLEQTIIECKIEIGKLEYQVAKLNGLKTELDVMYLLFDGPSANYPEEDEMEYKYHAAQRELDGVTARLDVESAALKLLAKADQLMEKALKEIHNAGGMMSWSENGAKNSLEDAQSHISNAQKSVRDAIVLCGTNITPLPEVKIDLDWYSADSSRRCIKRARKDTQTAQETLKATIRTQEHLRRATESSLRAAKEEAERVHTELTNLRTEIVKRVIAQGRPPEYELDSEVSGATVVAFPIPVHERRTNLNSRDDRASALPPEYTV